MNKLSPSARLRKVAGSFHFLDQYIDAHEDDVKRMAVQAIGETFKRLKQRTGVDTTEKPMRLALTLVACLEQVSAETREFEKAMANITDLEIAEGLEGDKMIAWQVETWKDAVYEEVQRVLRGLNLEF